MVFVKFNNMKQEKKFSNVAFKLKNFFTLQQVKTILQSQFTNDLFYFLLFSIYVLSILLKMSVLSFFLSFLYAVFLSHFHCPVAFFFFLFVFLFSSFFS